MPKPPESLPCPLCDGVPGERVRCYLVRVLLTGTQEWAYKCADCDPWWVVRWHPSRPSQCLIVNQQKRKPPQTAEAAGVQKAMKL